MVEVDVGKLEEVVRREAPEGRHGAGRGGLAGAWRCSSGDRRRCPLSPLLPRLELSLGVRGPLNTRNFFFRFSTDHRGDCALSWPTRNSKGPLPRPRWGSARVLPRGAVAPGRILPCARRVALSFLREPKQRAHSACVELPGAAARARVRDEGTGRRWRGAGLRTCVCGTRAAGPGMLLRRRHSSLHSRAHCNR